MHVKIILLNASEHSAMTDHERWMGVFLIGGLLLLIAFILLIRYVYLRYRYPPGKGYSYTFDHYAATPLPDGDILDKAAEHFASDPVLYKRITQKIVAAAGKYTYTVEFYFADCE